MMTGSGTQTVHPPTPRLGFNIYGSGLDLGSKSLRLGDQVAAEGVGVQGLVRAQGQKFKDQKTSSFEFSKSSSKQSLSRRSPNGT